MENIDKHDNIEYSNNKEDQNTEVIKPATSQELPHPLLEELGRPPGRGQGLNDWLHRSSLQLHGRYRSSEIVGILKRVTKGMEVKSGEIERQVERAAAFKERRIANPTGGTGGYQSWPVFDQKERLRVVENYPTHFPPLHPLIPESEDNTEAIIDILFPGNPLLCCGYSNNQFFTRPRETFRGYLSGMALIVPSPMSNQTGLTQEGKVSEHCIQNTGPRRFLVIEQDSGSLEEQTAVLLYLAGRAPLAMATHSGSKSVHGWFYCEGQSEETLRGFMSHAVSLGADKATWTISQFVRMPGGTRENGNHQAVLFFNGEVL